VLPRTFARKRVSISGLALAGQRLFVSAITREAITRDKPLPVFALDARTGRLTDWRAPQIKFADIVLAAHGLVFATNLSQTFVASARTGRPVAAFGTSPDFDHFAVVGDTLYANLGCPGPSQIQGQTRTLAAIDLRTLKVTPWAPVINPQAPKNHICLQALAADRSQVLLSAAGLLLPK
jgi:hypothetical protein